MNDPDYKDQEVRARLELAIGDEKPFAWAARVGIEKATFSRYWNQGTVPTGPILKKIAQAGISIDWLLTGEGSMRATSQAKSDARLSDLKSLRLALETVEQGLIETGRTMAPAQKAELAVAVYDLYAGSGGTVEKARVLRLIKSATREPIYNE